MSRHNKIAATLTAIMMMVLSFGIVIADNSSAEETPIEQIDYDLDYIVSVADMMDAIMSDPSNDYLIFDPDNPEQQITNALFIPILAALAVGVVVGLVLGYAAADLSPSNPTVPTATEDEINAALRELRADLIASNWNNVTGLFSKLVNNDAQLISFTKAYFNSQAETAAASLWTENGTYVGDRILSRSTFISNWTTYKYNVQSAINEFALAMSDQRDIFTSPSTIGTYGNMRLGWSWDSVDWLDQMGSVWSALTDYVIPTAENNRVYIDVIDYSERLENTNYLYVIGGNGTITNATTGVSYGVTAGANDLLERGAPSGWYDLYPGVTYAGNMLSSSSDNGAYINAGLILQSNDSYALAYQSIDGGYTVQKGSSTYHTETLDMKVTYLDADGVQRSATKSLTGMLDAYQTVTDAINAASVSAVTAGEAAWLIYDIIGESSALVKPSSLLTNIQSNTTLSAEVMAAVFATAMPQLATIGESINPNQLMISRESLDLYFHGDIYYRGVKVAQNAVFTIFSYEDASLHLGMNDFNARGIIQIWATNVPSLESWTMEPGQYQLVESSEGYQMQINDIVHEGVTKGSIDLTTESMQKLGLIGYDIPDNAPSWSWEEVETYEWALLALIITWMIFIAFLGILYGGGAANIIVLIDLVVGLILIGIVTGFWDDLFGRINDALFGWWPFTITR